MDYSGLTNTELTSLLRNNKIKGRGSATTREQKIKLITDFFSKSIPVSEMMSKESKIEDINDEEYEKNLDTPKFQTTSSKSFS